MNFKDKAKADLYNKVISMSKGIYKINSQLSEERLLRKQKVMLLADKEDKISEIERMVTRLYDLEEVEY